MQLLFREIENSVEGIDILVNNAGIGTYGTVSRTDVSDFQALMAVNFLGAVQCTLLALSHMLKCGGGLVVNIVSVAAEFGVPYLGASGTTIWPFFWTTI